MDNDRAFVASIKADLERRGVIPTNPVDNFTPFVIAAAYAWERRGQGAMLLKKPSGNRFEFDGQGYSIDVVSFSDGEADILGSAGPPANANIPMWDWRPKPRSADAVPPFDILARIVPPIPGPVIPPPVTGDLSGLTATIAGLAVAVRNLPTADQYQELVDAYTAMGTHLATAIEALERIERGQKTASLTGVIELLTRIDRVQKQGLRGAFSVRTIHLTPPE